MLTAIGIGIGLGLDRTTAVIEILRPPTAVESVL
jgi:hypothetical protein